MRLLHTMLRVGDLERSLAFYTEVLKMSLLRRKDYPSGRFTLAFVGYGAESEQTVLELTHNWDTSSYTWVRAMATLRWVWMTSMEPVSKFACRAARWFVNPVR